MSRKTVLRLSEVISGLLFIIFVNIGKIELAIPFGLLLVLCEIALLKEEN